MDILQRNVKYREYCEKRIIIYARKRLVLRPCVTNSTNLFHLWDTSRDERWRVNCFIRRIKEVLVRIAELLTGSWSVFKLLAGEFVRGYFFLIRYILRWYVLRSLKILFYCCFRYLCMSFLLRERWKYKKLRVALQNRDEPHEKFTNIVRFAESTSIGILSERIKKTKKHTSVGMGYVGIALAFDD